MATATGQRTGVRDRVYIGGEWVASSGSRVLEVVNSATEEVMGSVPEGTAQDVDRAVARPARRSRRGRRRASTSAPSGWSASRRRWAAAWRRSRR